MLTREKILELLQAKYPFLDTIELPQVSSLLKKSKEDQGEGVG